MFFHHYLTQYTYQLVLIMGRHRLIFGLSYRRYQPTHHNAYESLGRLLNLIFQGIPGFALNPEQVVAIPVPESIGGFIDQFTFPDFSQIGNSAVWITGITIAVVMDDHSSYTTEWTIDGQNTSSIDYPTGTPGTQGFSHWSQVDFFPSTNGAFTYCVKLTDTINNCDTAICETHTRDCDSSSTASINPPIDYKDNYLYPNPTSGILFSESFISKDNLELRDINGRKVNYENIKGGIDISMLPAGVYVAILQEDNSTRVQRIIKR